jgi:hypothetical protein
MAKRKYRKKYAFKKHPHEYLGLKYGRLTPTAKKLYDIIFFFGLGGCWMSNATLAWKLRSCKRAIQLARRSLESKGLICSWRANPKTVTSWSKYHPAVRCCEHLLYPGNLSLPNPFFDEYYRETYISQKHPRKK